MLNNMSSKVIVIGNVNGHLQLVFKKLAALHAKNSFSFVIIAGNLFSNDSIGVSDLIAGKIQVPLCTYFTVGDVSLPQQIIEKIKKNEEIVPNLHFLGKRSITKTSEGVRIVILGGKLDDSFPHGTLDEQYLPFHRTSDAKTLHGANSVDILVTTQWPASVRNGSEIHFADNRIFPHGYEHISMLCSNIKPRYHFSLTPEFFFEREPFFHQPTHDAQDSRQITRFISLSTYGIPKQKSFYAFNLPSTVDFHIPLPIGTTASPWNLHRKANKRQAIDSEYDSENKNVNSYKRIRTLKTFQRGQKKPPDPRECFFCLSNPKLETHLISSIGDDAYLTIAKGPLTTSVLNAKYGIEFPAHILIIPFTHSPTLEMIPKDDNIREKTITEMNRFRLALQNMISEKSGNKLGSVTYEISRRNGIHNHWQFIPVPENVLDKGLAQAAFRAEAESLSYPPFEIRDELSNFNDQNFFRIWIWTPPSKINSKGNEECLIMSLCEGQRFSLQFGRSVLAKLLGIENRLQWRDCIQSEEQEKLDNERFKAAFKEFDFAI